jgi:gliding motility-associated-like protein
MISYFIIFNLANLLYPRFMKYLSYITIVLLCSINAATAQNLVPNGSFEQYTPCPTTLSDITFTTGWTNYTNGSCDYFHPCATNSVCDVPTNVFGNETADDGVAYTGIHSTAGSGYREYLNRSITPLTVGFKYEVSISVSLADVCSQGCTGMGVLFFKNGTVPLATTGPVMTTPQIDYSSYGPITTQSGWVRLSAIFTADSTYDHIAIGNFGNPSNPGNAPAGGNQGYTYYYIDSVVVRAPHISFVAGGPYCPGDTLHVPVSVVPGFFSAGNVFTLELSDAAGSFASPIPVGSMTSATSGTIIGTLPANMPKGANYRIRIVATAPVKTSDEIKLKMGFDLVNRPVANEDTVVCESNIARLYAMSSQPGVTWQWEGPGSFSDTAKSTTRKMAKAYEGTYYLYAKIRGCVSPPDSVKVTVKTVAQPSIKDTVVCRNSVPVRLPVTADSLLWYEEQEGGTGNPKQPAYSTKEKGKIILYASSWKDGCESPRMPVPVQVIGIPEFSLGSDTLICAKEKVMIGTAAEDVRYLWSTGDTNCCTKLGPGAFRQSRTNICGTGTDEISIAGRPCDSCVLVPSAFTPNGDGRNDGFKALARCGLKAFSLKVFDRWGQLVFESKDIDQKWDGRFNGLPVELGTYFYLIKYTPDVPAHVIDDYSLKGDLMVVR